MPLRPAFTIVIMGVSGAGKSTVGKRVAELTDSVFADADDFHSSENMEKMSQGTPLTEADRYLWLVELQKLIRKTNADGHDLILACSALSKRSRSLLRLVGQQVAFVFLQGSKEQIAERLRNRENHFFNPALLDSQFDTLEPPERALTLDITATPEELAKQIVVPFFNRILE